MNKNKKWIQIVILTAVIMVGGYTIGTGLFSGSKFPQVGDAAPDFTLYELNGSSYKLSDYKGKAAVVINFWGTFCPPCIEEMPLIQSQYDKWKDSGELEVLGVNVGEPVVTVGSFVKKNKITFPILLDEGAVRKRYGANSYPTTFFVNKEGIIEHKFEGQLKAGGPKDQDIEYWLNKMLGKVE
jgi:peroxiredoxin